MSQIAPDQIVNVFCNITGAALNEAQRAAFTRLLTSIHQGGYDTKCKELEYSDFVYEGPTPVCDGCKTLGPDHQLVDLPRLGGKGTYCRHCRDAFGEES